MNLPSTYSTRLHTVDDDLEVELAHSGDDRLRSLGVRMDAERGIFLGELLEGDGQLVLVRFRLRLDRDGDDGFGEAHRLEDDRMVLDAQRVARLRVLQADRRRDVPGAHFLDFLALVGMHLQQPADPLLAVLGAVVDVRARRQDARVHAEERELPDIRVGHDLEREGRERLVIRRLALGVRRVVVGHVALDGGDVGRRREIIDHGVEQLLDALVLERRATQHRHDRARDRRLPQHLLDLVLGQLVLLQVFVEDGVVVLDDRLEQLVSHGGDPVLERRRHRPLDVLLPQRLVVVHDLDLADDVDQAREQLARAERQVDRHRLRAEPLAHHLHAHVEVRAHAVHLVDEDDARDVIAVRLAPHRLGLRLDAAHRVEHRDRAVQDTQAALDFDGEVDVSRRVDDVDAVLLVVVEPERGRGGRRDRDAALLLLLHPVHRGRTIVHLTQLVGAARVVQDALGRSRLPGIDVRHDADVPNAIEWCGARHSIPSFSKNAGRPGRPLPGRSRSATIRERRAPWMQDPLAQGPGIVG